MNRRSNLMQQWGVMVAFLVLFIASAIRDPGVFLQPENLRNLINQNVPVGILAIGMTLVIIGGGIDLAVGSAMALAGGIGVTVLNWNLKAGEASATWIASIVTILIGTLTGAINGAMVVLGRMAPFVATLVGLVAYRSLVLAMAEGGEVRSSSMEIFPRLGNEGIPLPFVRIAGGQPLVITWGIIIFFAVALVAGFILNKTRLGRYTIAVGANERAAKYSAINVGAVKFWGFVLLGFCVGLSALLQASRMNSVASASMGQLYELDAIAAVVIGGTSLRGGYGRIWGTVVGVLLLGIITNMLVVAGISVYWQGVVKGLVILAAVLLQRGEEAR